MHPTATMALLFCTALIAGCHANSEEADTVIYQSVGAVPVSRQAEFPLRRGFSGVLLPGRSADLAFEFGGTVQFMLADEGDRVEEGELLAQLDTSLLVIERRQLQAQLAEAETELRLAQANLNRQQSLEIDGFASQQRRDELEAGRDAIEATIGRLQATLDGNDVRQQKSHLYAPFSSVVSERYAEKGSPASPGKPVLHVLETENMEAHVGIPRQLARLLQLGQAVDVRIGNDLVTGEVLAVGAELKAQSHTVKVRVQLPPRPEPAGSLVQLQLDDQIKGEGFTVPQSALTASLRGLWRVYVLAPAEHDLHRIEARDIQLRFSDEQQAYVEGGLSDGELIVSEGVHKLVPGQLVRITRTEPSA